MLNHFKIMKNLDLKVEYIGSALTFLDMYESSQCCLNFCPVKSKLEIKRASPTMILLFIYKIFLPLNLGKIKLLTQKVVFSWNMISKYFLLYLTFIIHLKTFYRPCIWNQFRTWKLYQESNQESHNKRKKRKTTNGIAPVTCCEVDSSMEQSCFFLLSCNESGRETL